MLLPSLKQHVMHIAAVAATPCIAIVSTSNQLYLDNQQELGYQHSLMMPYLAVAASILIGGLMLIRWRERSIAKVLLWAYLLAGPVILIYFGTRGLFQGSPAAYFLGASLIIGYLVAVTRFSLRIDVLNSIPLFAAVGTVLVFFEVYQFVTSVSSLTSNKLSSLSHTPSALRGVGEMQAASHYPNIYHVVLDEYQTDFFELTLAPSDRTKLDGFVLFPSNTTLYGRTRMSIASVFLGTSYDYGDQQAFVLAPFRSEDSFLYDLRSAGYETFGFQYFRNSPEESLFDFRVQLIDYARIQKPANSGLFFNLWLATNFPTSIGKMFMTEEDLQKLRGWDVMPPDAPLISYQGFRSFLQIEPLLPGHNRYTYIHLMIPHLPATLRSDCTSADVSREGRDLSNAYHDQCRCASKIIIDLVTTLKELDRYEDSLIIIHGDHGSGRYVVIDDEPVDRSIGAYTDAFSFSRAHTLLLIKPPANGNTTKKFLVSDKETTLLDIAPTILDAVNLEIPERFEGESLLNPVDSKKTTRYYHFYRKIGARDMTDKMIRWIINQDHALRDEEIPIPLSSTPEN